MGNGASNHPPWLVAWGSPLLDSLRLSAMSTRGHGVKFSMEIWDGHMGWLHGCNINIHQETNNTWRLNKKTSWLKTSGIQAWTVDKHGDVIILNHGKWMRIQHDLTFRLFGVQNLEPFKPKILGWKMIHPSLLFCHSAVVQILWTKKKQLMNPHDVATELTLIYISNDMYNVYQLLNICIYVYICYNQI